MEIRTTTVVTVRNVAAIMVVIIGLLERFLNSKVVPMLLCHEY